MESYKSYKKKGSSQECKESSTAENPLMQFSLYFYLKNILINAGKAFDNMINQICDIRKKIS